jgi:outer membrane protein OmpA-like peptidoglycan-associated protein
MFASKAGKARTSPVRHSANMPERRRSTNLLQRYLGNQAQLRQLSAKPPPAPAEIPRGLQAKSALQIGPVDDPLEREADAVADQVMRMLEPAVTPAARQLSRKCAACEEEGKQHLQAKSAGGDLAGAEAPTSVAQALARRGQALDPTLRGLFEPRFGADFSSVRIHQDSAAARSAADLGALAYTVGDDIVFADGRHAPHTSEGRALLAHELVHVVQQRDTPLRLQRQIQPTCDLIPFDPQKEICCNGNVIPRTQAVSGPACQHLTSRDNEYDGCSLPGGLQWWYGVKDKDNPTGNIDTSFSDQSIHGTKPQDFVPTLPCDAHDKCFQTCGANRIDCNIQLIEDAKNVCWKTRYGGTKKIQECLDWVDDAAEALRDGSIPAFVDRQADYCVCCPPPAPMSHSVVAVVEFASGKKKVDEQGRKIIGNFVAVYGNALSAPGYHVTLIGQASRLGAASDNDRLSLARIAAVREAIDEELRRRSLAPLQDSQMDPQNLGEKLADLERPENPTDDSQEYRTVEIQLKLP